MTSNNNVTKVTIIFIIQQRSLVLYGLLYLVKLVSEIQNKVCSYGVL